MTSYRDAMRTSSQGVFLYLHVSPGSSQTMFPSNYNPWRKSIEIKVRSKAAENKANIEVLETIARFFNLVEKDVVLVSGDKQREKTVLLKKISLNVVEGKLKEYFNG